MHHLLRSGCLCAALLLVTGVGARAQELNGRVTDESGAVLPGVTVVVTQTDTSLTRTVVTDDTGTYAIPNLPTGPYRLEISLQGFRTYVQTGIVLQVGAAPTIDAVLAVGNLEETVSVESAAPIVDVRSAGISEVVEQERIVELPLQGRQVTDLIVLAGAAVETGRPNSRSFQGGVSISVGGSLDFGVAYILDGAMHNDPQNSGSLALPFPDALQEFRVATSGLSAQNGMHSGASVNAVTKSGTNVLRGNAFEFLRDKRFNATQVFAGVGPDGKRKDDGLKRNQFGGTLGGPIVRDRLFFFAGYQGTATRQTPAGNIAFVPTAAMMSGDFTAFASPACNGGRQLSLRGGFVNNQIDPRSFSPAGVNLAKRLPTTTDPCGKITWELPSERNEGQQVSKVDFQLTGNHSIFGRYMYAFDRSPSPLTQTDNILASFIAGTSNTFQALTLGDTAVFGANTVNSFRVAFNRTDVDRANADFFQPSDLGSKVYNYSPVRETVITVTDGFRISQLGATRGLSHTKAFQVGDDLTLVRGRHQIGLGANIAYWDSFQRAYAQGSGTWTFNGQATGAGLADMLMGRVAILEHGGYVGVTLTQWYHGAYVQDSWRATDRVTVNGGLRWEPFSGQQITDGAIANFSMDNFRNGVKSAQFVNAPAGFLYPGDRGFPSGRSGFPKRWWNVSPRAGVAWNVTGDGRLAVRSSYSLGYDFPVGEYWFRPAGGPPYGNQNRLQDPTGLFDDPYAQLGGDPHPIVTSRDTKFPPFGTFHVMDPNIQPPRIQSWNVTVERQLGPDWGVSASYLGSYADRIWGLASINPGLFMGLGPCTINGIAYATCTNNNNLNQRRALYQINPQEAQLLGSFDLNQSVGTQRYNGLKLSFQRRSATGLTLNGNYTFSRCMGLDWSNPGNAGAGYTNPADPNYDYGHCDADRTHLANFSAAAETPQFASATLRALASGWRASGIVNMRSGSWLSVTTGQTAFNGVNLGAGLRVNQVSDDVHGAKTLTSYLNRAAFGDPAPGTYGNLRRNSIRGPGFWKVDLAVSRVFSTVATHTLEIRAEAFNLLNNFNWGNPIVLFNSANFGRILTQAGDPRILQFGIKYGF